MLFYVTHEGQEHCVRVESRRNRLYVKFDDHPEERLDIVFHGNNCSFVRGSTVFAANVIGNKNDYTVWTPERTLNFKVESEHKRIVSKLRGDDLGSDNQVCAKMPGKIVRILKKSGERVSKGEAVIVMEAMKMENEIRSSTAGTVDRICTKVGNAVETGELLMELIPEDQ
ncbi:MAG: acetyl-CoA carboxylase biotin carboxyl carrier protein subunit [Bdellovibrionales bacterium]|nr:acetyl-CoA carboxylase biotin carboxyl carrier protein subunit [Bdellovibrionales bacterium]